MRTANYWTAAILLKDAQRCRFTNIHCYGRANTISTGAGIKFTGNCTDQVLKGCNFYWWAYAVLSDDEGDTTEGIQLADCHLVANDYCVYVDAGAGGNPFIAITNSHLSGISGNIYADNFNQMVLLGNNFIVRPEKVSGTFIHLELKNMVANNIIGNSFLKADDAVTSIVADFDAITYTSFTGNVAQNNLDKGLVLAADCSDLVIEANNMRACDVPYELESGFSHDDNRIFGDYAGCTLGLSLNLVDQTLTNATPTDISWASNIPVVTTIPTALRNAMFDSVGAPTDIVIPAGVSVVRPKAQLVFEAGGAGYVTTRFLKNGVPFGGYGRSHLNLTTEIAAIEPVLYIESTPTEVAVGDVITLEVTQSTGGDFDLQGSADTWLVLEIIR